MQACRICGLERNEFLQSKWPEQNLCTDCRCTIVPVAVTCNFKDGSGYRQTLTFDFDLIIGLEEKMQLKAVTKLILQQKGFLKTTAHKISYEILNQA